jgi:hypothetical protein
MIFLTVQEIQKKNEFHEIRNVFIMQEFNLKLLGLSFSPLYYIWNQEQICLLIERVFSGWPTVWFLQKYVLANYNNKHKFLSEGSALNVSHISFQNHISLIHN